MQEKNSTMFRTVIGLVIVATVALGCYYLFTDRPTAASQPPYMPIPDKEEDKADETDIEMPSVASSLPTSAAEGTASSERGARPGSSSAARKQTSSQPAGTSDKRIPFPDIYNAADDKQPLSKKVEPVTGGAVPAHADKRSGSSEVTKLSQTVTAKDVSHQVKPEPGKLVKEAIIGIALTGAPVLPQTGDDESEDINTIDVTKMPAVYEIGAYSAPTLCVDSPAAATPIHAPKGTFADGHNRVGTALVLDEHAWETSEELWGGSSLRALEDALAHCQGVLKELSLVDDAKLLLDERTARARIAALKQEVASASAAEIAAQARVLTLLAKFGAGHVQRNDPLTANTSFPSTGDIVVETRRELANFDAFACAAVRALRSSDEELSDADAASLFVHSIMRPVYNATQQYIQNAIGMKQARMQQLFGAAGEITSKDSDCVAWQFFLYAQQPLMLSQITGLGDRDVGDIAFAASAIVEKVQSTLRAAAGQNSSGHSGMDIDVLKIARVLLRLHAIALLSDPCCYLHPAPGERTQYRQDHCAELPCARGYGGIKEGETVEVVLCGLYFQDPASGSKPEVPAVVRRLL